MEIKEFDINGPLLVKLETYRDHRGFFVERFNQEKFESLSLPSKFVQDNFSTSEYSVLRGLHFQYNPPQGKLVSCTRGEIFDVAVDIRPQSSTKGKYVAVTLKGEEPSVFWIPPGFAHGFCVVSKSGADVLYKVTCPWSSKGEACLAWNDPQLNILWPIEKPILSPKDELGLNFENSLKISKEWNL